MHQSSQILKKQFLKSPYKDKSISHMLPKYSEILEDFLLSSLIYKAPHCLIACTLLVTIN
jgi:hypothetical protein